MKILPFQDNAFFIRFVRERLRKHDLMITTIVVALLAFLVVLLIYSSLESADREFSGAQYAKFIMCAYIAIQAIILLVMAPISIYRYVRQEKETGILDFHRASPTPNESQVMGLVFGAPIQEYVSSTMFLLLTLVLWCFSDVPLAFILKLYLGLYTTAIFFHCLTVVSALNTQIKSKSSLISKIVLVYLVANLIPGLIFMAVGRSIGRAGEELSPGLFSLLLGFNNFRDLFALVSRNFLDDSANVVTFFQYGFSALSLQIPAQALIGLFAVIASIRYLRHPERPILSKINYLVLCAVLLFWQFGFSYGKDTKQYAFWFLIFIFGIFGAHLNTPTHLQFLRGLRRAAKLKKVRLFPWADSASNLFWFGGHAFLSVSFVALLAVSSRSGSNPVDWTVLITLLAMVGWFAFLLEYFRLAKFKVFKYFILAIFILWIFLPLAGFLAKHGWTSAHISDGPVIYYWFSPIALLYSDPSVLTANILLMGIAALMAFQARRDCGANQSRH